MSNLEQFQYHVFISYGWADIQNDGEGDRGWVKEFKHQLQLQLNGELGRNARIFLDAEKKPNELEADLDSAIRSSALFLSILSPASCRENSWCRREIDCFTRYSADLLPRLGQVYTVLARKVEESERLLPQIVPWDLTDDGFPLPVVDLGNTATKAGRIVQLLARELKKALVAIDRQIAKTVFLSYTPQYKERIARLSTETTKRGNIAIRGSYEPGEEQGEFLKRTAGQLRRSGLSVHILDPAGDTVPPGWTDSVQSLQVLAAAERFDRVKNRMIISQESLQASGVAPEAMGLAQILNGTGFEYLVSLLLENLQARVTEAEQSALNRHEPILPPEPPDKDLVKPPEPPLYVFVDCAQDDLERLESLKPAMRARNIRIRPPVFDGDEEERNQLRDGFLESCNGVAVFYGSRKELKALIACQSLRKALRAKGREVPRGVIIDPDSEDRLEVVFPDFDNYRASKLEEFGRRVREWKP